LAPPLRLQTEQRHWPRISKNAFSAHPCKNPQEKRKNYLKTPYFIARTENSQHHVWKTVKMCFGAKTAQMKPSAASRAKKYPALADSCWEFQKL
jgi:hypothetical protein